MEQVIFKHGQGMGVILDHNERLTDTLIIDEGDIELGDTVLIYGQETTLCGWFDSPVKYCGKDHRNILYFYLGSGESSLFEEPKQYYETMLLVTPTRFYRNYSWKGGRDFNFINSVWK